MAKTESTIGVKLIAIGNSKGIRIPKVLRKNACGKGSTVSTLRFRPACDS